MDPTLEEDLQSKTKPWALSPLISTMPYFAHTRTDELHQVPPFPPLKPVQDDTSQLRFKDGERPKELEPHSPESRRAYFRDAEHRKSVVFGPNASSLILYTPFVTYPHPLQDVITSDFCYDYLSFSPTGVQLTLPAGMTFDMMKYWDGQPLYFVCCSRAAPEDTETGQPLRKVFWCVSIEVEMDKGATDDEDQSETQVQSDDID